MSTGFWLHTILSFSTLVWNIVKLHRYMDYIYLMTPSSTLKHKGKSDYYWHTSCIGIGSKGMWKLNWYNQILCIAWTSHRDYSMQMETRVLAGWLCCEDKWNGKSLPVYVKLEAGGSGFYIVTYNYLASILAWCLTPVKEDVCLLILWQNQVIISHLF